MNDVPDRPLLDTCGRQGVRGEVTPDGPGCTAKRVGLRTDERTQRRHCVRPTPEGDEHRSGREIRNGLGGRQPGGAVPLPLKMLAGLSIGRVNELRAEKLEARGLEPRQDCADETTRYTVRFDHQERGFGAGFHDRKAASDASGTEECSSEAMSLPLVPSACAYPDPLKSSHAEEWEALARQQGYFAVLGHEGHLQVEGNEVATPEFFATGESDVASLLSVAASLIGQEVDLTAALDFGCGAGRLTLPLARRAKRVTACDIAPTMLVHARANAEKGGLHNITYIGSDELLTLPDGGFTFVCSLLVFQYVPRSIGYAVIRTLLRLLAPGGIAVLQVELARPGEALRQLMRMVRAVRARPSGPRGNGMRTYQYDERVVLRDIRAADAQVVGRLAAHAGDRRGSVLIVQKARTPG
jgi:SAM-dependent methyltransferase